MGSTVGLRGGLPHGCKEFGLVGKYHSSVKCRQETLVQVLALLFHLQSMSIFCQFVLQHQQAPVGELQVLPINDGWQKKNPEHIQNMLKYGIRRGDSSSSFVTSLNGQTY